MNLEIPVTQSMLTGLAELDRFRGLWSARPGIAAARLAILAEAARVQSVAASCRLSGIRVSDADVAGVLRGEAVPTAISDDIAGYANALDQPLTAADALISTEALGRLHAALATGRPTREVQASPWRTQAMQREAFDAEGRATGRVFATLPPRLIPARVLDATTWLELELRSSDQHPVLVIGSFLLVMLAASPFPDRNGRMARLLIGHLMRRAGYEYFPFASVESQIEDLREEFHDAFQSSRSRLWAGEANLEPWLQFFVEVLNRHRERVEIKLEIEQGAASYSPLQRRILEVVREHGSVDAGLLMQATGANRNTLKDNLKRLVERGLLEKTGQRRGTRYRLAVLERAKPALAGASRNNV